MSSEENSLWKVKEKVSCLKDNRTPKLAFKQQSGQKREKQKHFRGVNSDTGSLTVNRHSYVGAQTVWLTNRSHRWCQLAQKSVTSHCRGGSRGSRQFTEDGDEDERSREPSMSSSVWFLVALRLRIKYIKTADRHDNMQPNHVMSCCNCNWSHTHTLNIAVPSAQCILDNPRFQTNVKEKRTKYFIYGLQWVTELINSSVNVYRGQREGPSLPLTSTGPETSLLQPQVSPPGG